MFFPQKKQAPYQGCGADSQEAEVPIAVLPADDLKDRGFLLIHSLWNVLSAYIYIYDTYMTHTHIYIYICIYVYAYMYICIYVYM